MLSAMPRIEILTVGDELLEGRLVDTNSPWLSERLADAGLEVARHTSVRDDDDELVAALREAAARADAVLVSGGLGPTSDDRTAACAAAAFGREIRRHPEAVAHLERFFAARGRPMAATNLSQTELPAGCELLANPHGTACGFSLVVTDGARHAELFFMPGVPRELEPMFETAVLPAIRARLVSDPPRIATLKIFGLGESDVAQRLEGEEPLRPARGRLAIQYRATFPEIHVRLVLRDGHPDTLEDLRREASRRLGRHVFAAGDASCQVRFADVVVDELVTAGATLAVAEDLAAGGVAALLAEAAEVRRVVLAGELHPVQEQPAPALAAAVRDRHQATFGVSVLPGREPDSFRAAVATATGAQERTLHFPVGPQRLRQLAGYVALTLVRRTLAPT